MQILRQHACQVLIASAVLGSASSDDVIALLVTKRAILYKIECALRIHREEYFTVYLGIAEIIFDTPTTTTTTTPLLLTEGSLGHFSPRTILANILTLCKTRKAP